MATPFAMSLPSSPPASPDATGPLSCPSCGFNLPPETHDIGTAAALLEARRTISELKSQVRLLTQKNSATADKLADYEDEIAKLRSANTNTLPSPPPSATLQDRLLPPPSPSRTSFSRISALLTRKSVPNLYPPPFLQQPQLKPLPSAHQASNDTAASSPDTPTTPNGNCSENGQASASPSRPPSQEVADALESAADFAAALAKEQSLRKRAEDKIEASYREIDDLTATLFERANIMVATERRQKAGLEERITMLERRDQEKRKRLDRLESAMNRIEKARTVLGAQRNSA